MTQDELDGWASDFIAFHERFAHLFSRREVRHQAVQYLRGLMAPAQRKNCWQIAEAVGDAIPDRSQRLLYRTQWDADGARDDLQEFIIEAFGDANGIGVVDESGFIKEGTHSVGVQRQYSGTAGKVENSQVGTFLTYASSHGHVFLDRRLYLPKTWCADSERRTRAHVPPEIAFQTKPDQAVAMLEHAWSKGVPMRWVAGDEVYGDSTALRDTVSAHNKLYVLTVPNNTLIWLVRPTLADAQREKDNRPRSQPPVTEGIELATTVRAAVAAWPETRWQRLTVADGAKGPRTYDWACQRVVESRDRLPGPDAWLLARRSLTDATDIAYYLSNASVETPLLTLAQVAATRYTVEQCLEEAKGETGLDEYEVRYWHSWYRHVTLSMMAHAWLASIRYKAMVQKGGLNPT